MAKKEKKVEKSKAKESTGKKSKESSSDSKKKLSPLEKARLAKAKGGKTDGKKKAKKKNALPVFKAPEDFKPHFVTVLMKVEKDGLLSSAIKATRYQGRYDPDADDKKKFDIASYDPKTVQGILSRFAMTTFATNVAKRLPAGAIYQALLRVNKKAKEGDALSVLFKGLDQAVKNDKGRVKLKPLDKKDPIYRKFRKAARILPSAFKEVLQPPKRTRGANKKDADDE
jgi:hypothetical protein